MPSAGRVLTPDDDDVPWTCGKCGYVEVGPKPCGQCGTTPGRVQACDCCGAEGFRLNVSPDGEAQVCDGCLAALTVSAPARGPSDD